MKGIWMSTRLKVMIAEDDARLRQYLSSLLSTFPELDILASAADGCELLLLASEQTLDAVFLDVEMPGMDGFDTAIQLMEQNPDIAVVFITGHAELGIRGFDIGAVDYLSKPISHANLERSIGRIKAFQKARETMKRANEEQRLMIKNGRETYFIDPGQVLFVEKVNRVSIIHYPDRVYYSTETLELLGKRLGERFLRSHRGYIVNIDRVEKIEPDTASSFSVSFYNANSRALLSKNKLEELMMLLAGRR